MLEILGGFQEYIVWDAMWAAGVIAGMLLFAFTLGKHAMVPLLAGMSLAATFAGFAPFVDRIPGLATLPGHEQQIVVFLVLTVVGFIVCRKNHFFEPCIVQSAWELAIFAVVYAGFMLAIMGSLLPPEVVETMSLHVRIVFVDDFPRIFWLAAPFVLLSVLRGNTH